MIEGGDASTATAHRRGDHGVFGFGCTLCLCWLLRESAAGRDFRKDDPE
jgi:hypothetical protein